MPEPNPFIGEIVIRPYRVFAAYLILIGITCSAICRIDGAWERMGAVPLVTGAALLALGMLRFQADNEFIRIDEHGVTIRKMFLEELYSWPEVKRFEPSWHRFFSSAIYVELENPRSWSFLRFLSYFAHNRADILILTWYFVDQFEMAKKLNQWKESNSQAVSVSVR